jgi:hypothetical protein
MPKLTKLVQPETSCELRDATTSSTTRIPLDAGMSRKEYWRLEVHFWPEAIARNEQPMEIQSFSKEDPGNYASHSFDFERQPLREQFEWLVNCLPWAWTCWHETLLPLLNVNEWPVVEPGYKRAETELRDATPQRREVCNRYGLETVINREHLQVKQVDCPCGKMFLITKQPNKKSKRGRLVGKLVIARQTLYAFEGR